MKVLKENRDYENDYVIIEDDSIETKYLCDCHGDHGVVIGCHDAGCYTKEDDNWKKGDEETHIEIDVYEYHDGNNWQSVTVDEDQFGLETIDDDEEVEILEHYENAEWGEWNNGICTGETDKYEFTKSPWQGNFGVADVKIK